MLLNPILASELPCQCVQPTPLSRRIVSGGSCKLLGWLAKVAEHGPQRGANRLVAEMVALARSVLWLLDGTSGLHSVVCKEHG